MQKNFFCTLDEKSLKVVIYETENFFEGVLIYKRKKDQLYKYQYKLF